MKQRLLSLFIAVFGIAAGAQAQSANSVYVGTQSLSDGTYEAGDLTALAEGSITYNSSQKLLTLNNAVINNASGNGLRITLSGLTVKTIGECVINASNYGLDLYTSVTIDGNGSSAANKLEITSSGKSGIHFYTGGCTLTLSNDANVSSEGKEYGIVGKSSSPSKLAMTGQYTQLWFKGGTSSIKDMDLSDGPQRHGFAIYQPIGAKYQASTKTIVDTNGNEVKDKWVLFQKGIAIDEANFPDENFRNWILAQDYGKDYVLSDEDVAAVTEMNVSDKGIASMQGIEFFTSLTELQCYGNEIRGESMETLINSLPDKTDTAGNLYVYKDETPEGNEIAPAQVTAAKAKKWNVKWWGKAANGSSKWIDFELISINEANFPDANFRNYVLAQSYGADGIITNLEISAVKEMPVYSKEIANLKGIEFFTALTYLSCSNNQLTTLDVSMNTELTTLQCDGNQLTALDVSKNTKLGNLRCEDNQLTALNLSKNTELKKLSCGANQLTTLDVSKNTALEELRCYQNAICGAEMNALVNGLCDRRSSSEGKLYVYSNETPTGNEILVVQVNAAKDKNWKVLKMDGGDWVDYEGEPALTIDETNFPDENFRNWILGQDYGKDGYLSDREITAVTEMHVSGKSISNLQGIEIFTSLTELHCGWNNLTTLDVSKNTALTHLNCSENDLTALDFSLNTALTKLDCTKNILTTLEVTKNTALTELDCSMNKLTTLDVSQNTALTHFNCSENNLTAIDVSQNTALTELMCGDNPLSTLDVSKNTALTGLLCCANQLTNLDVSQNTALTELGCYGNQLTTLDISKNTSLEYIICALNAIRGEGMAALVESLPDVRDTGGTLCAVSSWNMFELFGENIEENNEMNILQVAAAKAKGWKVLKVVKGSDGADFEDYEGEKVDAQLAFSVAAVEATLGGAFTAPTLTATLEDESLKTSIKYESSDKTVATVDESTGKVTLLKAGVTNISATVVNDTYKGSAYYKLTVVNPIKGDANSDEKVDAADIVAFINYMKGEPSAKFNKVAADVNNDGNVNYVDMKEIKNIIFGKSRPAATATAGDVGKLICTAGHIHAYSSDDGCTADRVALIISVGGYTGNPIYKHGLALALADESSTMDWTTAKATVEAHSPTVAYAEWMLPDWELLVNAFGGGHYAKNLRESFSSVGGTNILVGYYWDKEEWGSGLSALAECYIFYEDYSSAGLSGSPYLDNKTMLYNVRACLAF